MTSCSNPITVDYDLDNLETFSDALKKRETVIEKGLKDAAIALQEIKKYKLYKLAYSTFEEYCRERWNASRHSINFILAAYKVKKNIGNLNYQNVSMTALGQHIARLKSPKAQKEVTAKVTANGHTPTVKEIKKAVDEKLGIRRKISNDKLVVSSWTALTEGKDIEESKSLAKVYIGYLFKNYPELMDIAY